MIAWLHNCRTSAFYSSYRRHFSSARNYVEDKRWPGWEVVVGIEVHAQIKSRRKLFSETLVADFGEQPNTHVSSFDAAFPGTLPKLNQKCVALAIRTALALNSNIQLRSTFDRKHYFYPDLPAGYQITQHYAPIALGGYLDLPLQESVSVRIKQIQLEQDTAKSIFDPRARQTLVDLNRAGMGLMEIVSEPDMRSPEEAGVYVRTLQSLLRTVGTSDGNMEQGSLRCDVNVSVNRPGSPLGTRCEIKNLNSVKFMMAAISHEIQRHISILSSSSSAAVPQETRGFSENTFETFKLRSKEDAPDYRYMPDMNLGTLHLNENQIQTIRENMPELPDATRARLQNQYNLNPRDVEILLNLDAEKDVPFDGGEVGSTPAGAVAFFESICQGNGISQNPRDPKVVINWIIHELVGHLAARRETFTASRVPWQWLAELIDLVQGSVITRTAGKTLLREILTNPSPEMPKELAHRLDLIAFSPSSDTSTRTSPQSPGNPDLLEVCRTVITSLPAEVSAYKAGNLNVLNKIVGHVMKVTRGRANALTVKSMLQGILDAEKTKEGCGAGIKATEAT